ncbi:MAG: hypothetical protein BGO31_16320 [Bacteroidetes bacterium 43-16]|nr:MAG: hypothetical protein BGO31_16320 [Bacteroidetes bacterium 43-16]
MSLLNLIEPTIPVLKPNDSVDDALRMMSDTHFDRLPLIDKGVYISIIKEPALLDWEDPDTKLSKFPYDIIRPACIVTAHPFDAVKVAIQFKLPVVPVLNERQEYLGCVSRDALFHYLGESGSLSEQGGIIVMEVKPQDYVLSQIARIAENEDVKILNSRVYLNPQTDMLEITLKMNKVELQRVVAALERYDYVVKEVYGDIPAQNDLDDRYKLLMNYLNI